MARNSILAGLILAGLLIPRSLRGEDTLPPNILRAVEQMKKARVEQLGAMRTDLSQREAALKKRDRNRTKADAQIMLAEITKLKDDIAALEKDHLVPPAIDLFNLGVGALGTIPRSTRLRIAQVIDDTNVHVIPSEKRSDLDTGGTRVFSPTQLARAAQTFREVDGERVVFRVMSTATMADEQPFAAAGVWEVTGTTSYITITGAKKTIFVLEPIEWKKWQPMIAAVFSKTEAPEVRKWSDSTGKFSIMAIFAGYSDGNVTLRKEDGVETSLPLAKLSKDDQTYVRNEIAKAKKTE